MNRTLISAAITAAFGLAVATQGTPAFAQAANQKVVDANVKRANDQKLEPCYGIAAAGQNDCASDKHGCAGLLTTSGDPNSFVLLPTGMCGHINGGALTAKEPWVGRPHS